MKQFREMIDKKYLLIAGLAIAIVGAGYPLIAAPEREGLGGENARTQDPEMAGDADKLYALIKQARSEIRTIRELAGLHGHASGPHIDPEGHHEGLSVADRNRENNEGSGHEDGGGRHEGREAREGRGERHEGRESREGRGERHEGREAREGRGERHEGRESRVGRGERHEGREAREGRGERHEGRESREGRGERHEGREGRGEHTRERGERGGAVESQWIPKLAKHVKTYKNGGRLTLQYNAATEAFVGNVVNTTDEMLSDVRVEVHLSNGIELGPTKRTDLLPGATLNVELSAVDQSFNKWVTHPEAGIEEGHGIGGEEGERGHEGEASERAGGHREEVEGRGEHAEGGGDESLRPREQAFRPLFNQLQLLRGEMKAFSNDLKAKP